MPKLQEEKDVEELLKQVKRLNESVWGLERSNEKLLLGIDNLSDVIESLSSNLESLTLEIKTKESK